MEPNNMNDPEKDIADTSSISSDLIRGHINTIILRTLYDSDKYGYEIINDIEAKSKGQYTLKQPTLYSALKRLESQDYVTSYWGGASGGGRRKYFQITEKGRKIVEQNLAEWEYSRTVIDSLISEKDYDFNNPPPSHSVDFNILKKSTTRVPFAKGEDTEDAFMEEDSDSESFNQTETVLDSSEISDYRSDTEQGGAVFSDNASLQNDAYKTESEIDEQRSEEFSSKEFSDEGNPSAYTKPQAASVSEDSILDRSYYESHTDVSSASDKPSPAGAVPSADAEANEKLQTKEQHTLSEEDKQRIHENYKVLIGEETDATAYYYSHVKNEKAASVPSDVPSYREQETAYSENIDAVYDSPVYPENVGNGYEKPPVREQNFSETPNAPEANEYNQFANDSGDMLYANKSPAERNYKELLSKLYDNTYKSSKQEDLTQAISSEIPEPQPAQTFTEQPRQQRPSYPPAEGKTASNIEFYDVAEKAENEGIKITTTNGARNRTVSKSIGNTFDKGKALFISAVFVFIVAMAEAIINICLRAALHTNAFYVVLPFVVNFAMLGVFLFLYLRGYGKNSKKTQAKSYLSSSLIIYVSLVLIVCVVAYLIIYFNDAPFSFTQILKYGIFPCVYLFNIPLFALIYNYNCNRQ